MDKNFKNKMLKCIGTVYEKSKKCKLNDSIFETLDEELTYISDYLKTSKTQALFVAITFVRNTKGEFASQPDLIHYFDCNPLKMLEYNDDWEDLETKNILLAAKKKRYESKSKSIVYYIINNKIPAAILNNKPLPDLKEKEEKKNETVFHVFEKIEDLISDQVIYAFSEATLFHDLQELLLSNKHFPLIKRILDLNFNIEDTFIFLELIWNLLSGRETISVNDTLNKIYDKKSDVMTKKLSIVKETNPLIKDGFVEIQESYFIDDVELGLTEKSHNLLHECDSSIFTKRHTKRKDVILSKDILHRKLFFSETEMKQLFLLKNLLKETNLKKVQKRLTQKKLPKGIAAILHGAPGTGKTEVVKQIARETKREIMKVEISQSKSMWYGQSEKIIKQIFNNYNSFTKGCKRTPILFLNEADAILSKRREVSDSISQTENAIQNILLEEIENFEGILIATTNLIINLDKAFERRFLFKIKFQKPTPEIRAKIWHNNLPTLTPDECLFLAEKYNFSGGQINNIIRKKEIYEIIHGTKVPFEKLQHFCMEETYEKTSHPIGFKG